MRSEEHMIDEGFYPPSLARLITELSKIPSIGPKTAERIALCFVNDLALDSRALALALLDAEECVGTCERCFYLSEAKQCAICKDPTREPSVVCVVEDDRDVMVIERAGVHHGLYHVLGGALSPLDGIEPEDLKIAELVSRVLTEQLDEVIVATSPTTSGESTALCIAKELKDTPVLVSVLDNEWLVGTFPKDADYEALRKAFTHRTRNRPRASPAKGRDERRALGYRRRAR